MTQVANTILEQLGGDKFRTMTGAKDFVGGDNSLMFSLPRGLAKNQINKVRITLNSMDTYDIEFLKYITAGKRRFEMDTISISEGNYSEMLQSQFKEATGLNTSL